MVSPDRARRTVLGFWVWLRQGSARGHRRWRARLLVGSGGKGLSAIWVRLGLSFD